MTICSSCEGEVEAATGLCVRCGNDQAGSGSAVNDGPVSAPKLAIPSQAADDHIYLASKNATVLAGELSAADAVDPDAADADAADAEAVGTGAARAQAAGAEVAAALVVAEVAGAEGAGAEVGGAEGAAAAAVAESKGDKAEEKDGLIATYRARRLRIEHLNSPPLRLVMWVGIVQIAVVTVLMVLQRVPQPLVNSTVPDVTGGTFAVPLVVFIITVISIATGYWFGLAAALRIRPAVGIPIAALATWTLADTPISSLRMGATAIGPHLTDTGLRWGQLGVLGVFWIWLGYRTVARRQARREKSAVNPEQDEQPKNPGSVLGALVCVLAYYALEIAIWALYARAGQAAVGTGSLLADLGVQAVLLPTFLVLVVLLGSTDLLEWGEIAVQSFVGRAKRRRPPRLLMILTPLVAVGLIANAIRLDGINVLPELAVVGLPVALIALLVRLARGYGSWSGDIRSRAVITGAVVVFIYITILLTITAAIRSAAGWSPQLDDRFYSLVSTPIALAALFAGLLLLAHGRIGSPEQRGRGLLLVIAGALIIIAGLPDFLSAAGLPAVFPSAHFSLVNGLQVTVSLGALGWMSSLARHKRLQNAGAQLANVLALLAGLLIVSLILWLLNAIASLSADSDYALAALFFLTVFWGFATSGDKLTGATANTAAYPRDGRILLAVSYTLVSSATLLYLGALRPPGGRATTLPNYLTADPVTPLGLAVLGSALVMVAFVAKASRGTGKAAAATAAAAAKSAVPEPAATAGRARGVPRRPSRPRVPWRTYRAAQVAIAGTGVVATGAALVILVTALPQLSRASAALLGKPYLASVPGPGCDDGGALWPVTPGEPIAGRCSPAGLHVEIGPGPDSEGDVEFLPPYGFASQNYRVSVEITFSRGFAGCAGIFTRASAAGRYLTAVCGDGSVDIEQQGGQGKPLIFLGFTDHALTYVISAVSQSSGQSVYIDGTKLGSVTSTEFSKTEYVGLAIINPSSVPGSAVFSNFSFTPLPATG